MTTPAFQTIVRPAIPGQPPTPATPLLGRARELLGVRDLLGRADVRLVSLVGPGGVGKTRLALASLASSVDDFADGACWVALAALTETSRVWPSVARALGILDPPEGTAALEVLKRHLKSRSMVLALDNVEHLIDVAPEVVKLLEACPQLKMLVTSRRALRVRSEHEYAVHPLELPAQNAPLEVVTRNDAVQLFVQRARAVRSDFSLNPHNASTIAHICARLDGLPLALELAASRLRLFTIENLLERLSAPLDALVGGPRDASERQRSLRATLEWSLTLLEASEQQLFARLGVFTGGFDLEAAEAIGGPNVLAPLEVLVEQSLVRSENGRFSMLETIRERALEQLLEHGDTEALYEQHARYFLGLCQRAETEIYGPNQTMWIDRLEADLDNLRAAMRWGLEHDPELTLFIARAPYPMWKFRGHSFEAILWLERGLKCDPIPVFVRAQALEKLGEHLYLNRAEDAQARYEEALELYRTLNEREHIVSTLLGISRCVSAQERHEEANAHLEEALEIARQDGQADTISRVNFTLGMNRFVRLDFEGARQNFVEALESTPAAASPGVLSQRYQVLGMTDYMLGNVLDAKESLERALEIAQVQRNLLRQYGSLMALVTTLAELGEIERAHELLGQLRDVTLQLDPTDDPRGVPWLLAAASIAVSEKRPVRAARLVGAAQQRSADGELLAQNERLIQRFASKAVQALGDAWERAVAEGRELEIEQILSDPEPTASRHTDGLSAREFEVIALVADGLTDAEIANQLGIRPRTVSTHLTNVYNKFGVRSRTQAVREAQKRGLLETA